MACSISCDRRNTATAGRRHGHGTAFTLVELVIVVAILAVLMAILLPSLAAARRQAQRAACAAHLHGLEVGWETYAVDWNALPMLARRAGDINLNKGTGALLEPTAGRTLREQMMMRGNWAPAGLRFVIFHVNLAGLGKLHPDGYGEWRNWGLLHKSRSVPDPRAFFCPAQKDPFLRFQTAQNPWPPREETALLDDGRANHTNSSFERRLGLSHVPWERVPLATVIATDVLDTANIRQTHRAGVNAAFRDGHVAYIRHPRLLEHTRKLDAHRFINTGWKQDIFALYDWLDARY